MICKKVSFGLKILGGGAKKIKVWDGKREQ